MLELFACMGIHYRNMMIVIYGRFMISGILGFWGRHIYLLASMLIIPLILINGQVWVDGVKANGMSGNDLRFNSINEYVNAGSNPTFNVGTDTFTTELRSKPNMTNGNQFIINKADNTFINHWSITIQDDRIWGYFSRLNSAISTTYGAGANPTGSPIGGGAGYKNIIMPSQAAYIVNTKVELLNALANAKSGQIVYISDSAQIDLSGERDIVIPAGVTLTSGRGNGGSNGALLYTKTDTSTPTDHLSVRCRCFLCRCRFQNQFTNRIFNLDFTRSNNMTNRSTSDIYSLFRAGGSNVRITGLRIQGNDPDCVYCSPDNAIWNDGISSAYPNFEVDNIEIWGWNDAAILIDGGATNAYIHHNYIHNNRHDGQGYGVAHGYSAKYGKKPLNSLIEANIFDLNRHSIQAAGDQYSSYEARYNIVMEGPSYYQSFDRHGTDNGSGGYAGDWTIIHHNTFMDRSDVGFKLRGEPYIGAQIYNNWFYQSNEQAAIYLEDINASRIYSAPKVEITNNWYGTTPPPLKVEYSSYS